MLGRDPQGTIDPSTPTMPGQSTSGFHRPRRQTLLAPSAKRSETTRATRIEVAFIYRLKCFLIDGASLAQNRRR